MTDVSDAVDFAQFRWRLAAYVVGALLAGGVAGTARGLGADLPTATVVGLSLAVPFVELADHADDIPPGTHWPHAALVVLGGLVVGGVALVALPLVGGASGGLAVAVVAGATYAGGAVAGLAGRRRGATERPEPTD